MESKSGGRDLGPVIATLIVFAPVLAFIILGFGTALDAW